MAQNQTLRINIKLPAGVGLSSGKGEIPRANSSENNELGSDLYSELVRNIPLTSDNGFTIPVWWIKMDAFENSQFLLDFKSQGEIDKTISIFYLNDDSNNFQNALPLKEYPALLSFNQNELLIRSFVPRKITLSSWLGIKRENQPMTLILEYF